MNDFLTVLGADGVRRPENDELWEKLKNESQLRGAEMTREELIEVFREKGLTVTIGGCGCCSSPWVKVTAEGRVFDGENFDIDMHAEMEGDKT